MNKPLMSTGLRWLWLSLIVMILDLGSKQWVMAYFWLGEVVPIFPFINFTYSHNPGAAFSFLADQNGWQCWVFSSFAMIFSVVILVMMYHANYNARLYNVARAIIVGGALSNLIDRMVHSVVIDFIDFYIGNWHWPTFNIADFSICIGTTLVMLESFFQSTPNQAKK